MTHRPFQLDVKEFGYARIAGQLRLRHGFGLIVALLVSLTTVYAQQLNSSTQSGSSAISTLIIWMPYILKGFVLNLVMSFLAMALATLLGIGLGLMQISQFSIVSLPARFVTHLFRNSPWLVILFVAMYLLPIEFPWRGGQVPIPDWTKATFAFALPVMGNISEILRGAVNSIPKGQWESAEGLAFTRSQTLRWVILPQCVRRAIPPWMNWYALLTLSTPMASIFSIHDAVANAQAAMEAAGAQPQFLLPFYFFLLCLFFAYIYPISLWTRKLEQQYAVKS